MKKTLLALAVMTAASGANAFELYNQDGTSVSMKGEVDIYLQTSEIDMKDNSLDSTQDAHIYTWAYTQIDFEHKINDSVTAFGSFEIEGDGNSAAAFDDVVAGFKGNFGKVSLGETGSSYGVLEKTEVSNEQVEFDVVYNSSESKGKGARYEITVLESLALSADLQTRTNSGDKGEKSDYALSADYTFGDFSVAAAYLDSGKVNKADKGGNAFGVSASADISDLYVAATFTSYEGQGDVGVSGGNNDNVKLELGNHEGTSMGIALAYTINDARIYGAYQMIDADKDMDGNKLDAEGTNFYVGADYAIISNLTAYVEYGQAEITGKDVIVTKDGSVSNVTAGIYLSF
ncbi:MULTISPECIES: porin [Aliivibrio]|uniref:Porin n=1 Tax=Aliivibrio finisterrensis TaxID=511998 RepID=A0A4Q5KTI6_9GAMM|nr:MULTISPECIES: porin [Aliivibrio]MDD9179283.1 porin [Aliivibrio sp. A6]RYU51119.1 porin [Aliivibrio finisterrensis]RYU55529.1 porin [Aliivibrio finisterrensis]RYU60373.1 porin [Aliivibrio finisterrensis]RYU64156.1 porin [Aliivibrio finisterrensis]